MKLVSCIGQRFGCCLAERLDVHYAMGAWGMGVIGVYDTRQVPRILFIP